MMTFRMLIAPDSRHLHFLGNRDLHFDRFRHLDTVEAADRDQGRDFIVDGRFEKRCGA